MPFIRFNIYKLLLCAVLCAGAGAHALAATQGSLGSPSTGGLDFSVSKPPRADITGISDLTLPNWSIGDGAVKLTDDICVYSTRPSGGYTVTATGSGAGGAFELTNGLSTLVYSVDWNHGGVGALSDVGDTLTAGAASGGFANAATDSSSCNGGVPGPTARLIVRITNADMVNATSGNYTGSLTLLIAPN